MYLLSLLQKKLSQVAVSRANLENHISWSDAGFLHYRSNDIRIFKKVLSSSFVHHEPGPLDRVAGSRNLAFLAHFGILHNFYYWILGLRVIRVKRKYRRLMAIENRWSHKVGNRCETGPQTSTSQKVCKGEWFYLWVYTGTKTYTYGSFWSFLKFYTFFYKFLKVLIPDFPMLIFYQNATLFPGKKF